MSDPAVVGEELVRSESYAALIARDQPVAYWRFDEPEGRRIESYSVRADLAGTLVGGARLGFPGPRRDEYPLFDEHNQSLSLVGAKSFARVADPGADSALDFSNGDEITIEAWVRPEALAEGQQVYIVGKGRTNNEGFPRENQNYALRLRGMSGTARVSFLFRRAASGGEREEYHRWNSSVGFVPDGTWHHVAIVYAFGHPERARAYIDGQESGGTWDMGGPTAGAPVVDDDELWIGSALGGSLGNTLQGQLDEVVLYRRALDRQTLIDRYQAVRPDPREAEFAAAASLQPKTVSVELYERLPQGAEWSLRLGAPTFRYEQDSFAWVGFPKKYTASGVIADRSNPFLLRARSRLPITAAEAGVVRLLLRSKNAARLYLNGELIAQNTLISHNADGHEPVPELAVSDDPDLRPLPAGCQEQLATVNLTEGEHLIRLDAVVGGKGLRLELDEVCVAISRPGEPFVLLSAESAAPIPLTEEAWAQHQAEGEQRLVAIDQQTRHESSREWREYWERRHELARDLVEQQAAPPVPQFPAHNAVDHFLGAKLAQAGLTPALLTDDYAFLRRVTLDTVGVVPSAAEIAAFIADQNPGRRAVVIDRLLDDPRWADHWMGYWQDVLAENPGILKPELNNTGPFRWWIHESFLDNKPFDRFATELVMMEGSSYYGGPAGFAMATQNDAPLAAKAHVLAKAFLAMDMTCARCHDAPYHPFKQRELFSLAAMLDRQPITLPESSTVPVAPGARKPLIEISLTPGATIEAAWPFAAIAPVAAAAALPRQADDSREQLAAALVFASENRFAKVLVNRLWARYLGRGLIEPVDDWESAEGESPQSELLEYLARELIVGGYDLKRVARRILNSHAYQREVSPTANEHPELFASPVRRRMTAEQLVDSLLAASGKQFRTETLTLDPEGRRPVDTFLNLGDARRAWQFTSLSNERDRPALALPMAQGVVDLLLAYGWRDTRPNPLTVRDDAPTVLQPLTLANGILGARAVRLSEDSSLTRLCLEAATPEELVSQVCLQILSRPPTDDELQVLTAAISAGFAERVVAAPLAGPREPPRRNAVSWSNHLSAEATKIKLELERLVLAGDPPTARLDNDWRQRMEDVVWALFNSPEFAFVP